MVSGTGSAWVVAWDVSCCGCGMRYRTVAKAAPTHCPRCTGALREGCCCEAVPLRGTRTRTAATEVAVRAHRAELLGETR